MRRACLPASGRPRSAEGPGRRPARAGVRWRQSGRGGRARAAACCRTGRKAAAARASPRRQPARTSSAAASSGRPAVARAPALSWSGCALFPMFHGRSGNWALWHSGRVTPHRRRPHRYANETWAPTATDAERAAEQAEAVEATRRRSNGRTSKALWWLRGGGG